jgi:hypothetical protein
MHIETKTLPDMLKQALRNLDYGATDIEVRQVNSISLGDMGSGDGRKSFTVLINLETGEMKRYNGSWGGINMFNLDNPVDTDTKVYPMVPGMLVIKGSIGYPRTFATIYTHRDSSILPVTSGVELTKVQKDTLYCFKCIKGGEYRREEMFRRRVTKSDIQWAIDQGYVKVNKAGAMSITTEGKNALPTNWR